MTCNTSRDCLQYFDDDILRSCLGETDSLTGEKYCVCNEIIARRGPSCTQDTLSLNILRFQIFFNICFAFTSSVSCLNLLNRNKSEFMKLKSLKSQKAIIIFNLLGNFLFFIGQMLIVPSLLSPTKLAFVSTICMEKIVEKIIFVNVPTSALLTLVGLGLIVFGVFTQIFSWFDVLKDLTVYFPKLWGKREKLVEQIVKYNLYICCSLNITFVFIGQQNLTIVVSAFSVCFTCACFAFLMSNFFKNLKQITSGSNAREKALLTSSRINKSFKQLMVCLVAAAIANVFRSEYEVICYSKSNDRAKTINLEMFFLLLAYSCVLIQTLICLKEVNIFSTKILKTQSKIQESRPYVTSS